jgi:hypothetical protein
MRATATVGGLLLFAWASTAMATDCVRWRKLDADAKQSEVSGMIEDHLNSNTSKSYTSEHRVAFQRCLRGFLGQIVEELDEACTQRPGANAEYVDDVFDRYLLSCVQ